MEGKKRNAVVSAEPLNASPGFAEQHEEDLQLLETAVKLINENSFADDSGENTDQGSPVKIDLAHVG